MDTLPQIFCLPTLISSSLLHSPHAYRVVFVYCKHNCPSSSSPLSRFQLQPCSTESDDLPHLSPSIRLASGIPGRHGHQRPQCLTPQSLPTHTSRRHTHTRTHQHVIHIWHSANTQPIRLRKLICNACRPTPPPRRCSPPQPQLHQREATVYQFCLELSRAACNHRQDAAPLTISCSHSATIPEQIRTLRYQYLNIVWQR
ncbi:uncharacterized protein CTRU02_213753 [Colletotrichum truncatum]|uniref:Uncharacterized protein n=1 Tax=Colletotrichum truncatum TaxID=5467 RepID=A0ACC3YGN3_COLTU|nr:uncharacterized protein CTRU02_14677 [Colletotrichum truncatum]KAF6781893.1 hypothetical protein CTRU02_14677 [Colletotrichum truncatum]